MIKKRIGAIVAGIVIVAGIIVTLSCTERIPTGYVGVQYSMQNGVENNLLTRGWRLKSPTTKIFLYSTKQEQLYMSADKREGSENDDSLNVMANDGQLNVDFEMSYSFNPDDIVATFEKFGGMSGEDIVNTKVRGRIRTLISEVTSKYSVMDIHLDKKVEVNKALTEYLAEHLKEYGITVESATISRTQPSEKVVAAIEKRTTVAQELEAEKLAQEKAKLEQETKKIEAETKAIENQKIEQSLSREMLAKMWIDKWDGKLPSVNGGSGSLIANNIPSELIGGK